jgi:hypothetical protein
MPMTAAKQVQETHKTYVNGPRFSRDLSMTADALLAEADGPLLLCWNQRACYLGLPDLAQDRGGADRVHPCCDRLCTRRWRTSLLQCRGAPLSSKVAGREE